MANQKKSSAKKSNSTSNRGRKATQSRSGSSSTKSSRRPSLKTNRRSKAAGTHSGRKSSTNSRNTGILKRVANMMR